MTWLRRTLDHLFTEPREMRPPAPRFSSESARRHHDAEQHRKEMEIEIEARRGVVGF